MRSLTPPQALFFGAVLATALVLALFPVFPRQLRVQEDDIASRTIRSPREETFESALLTDQAREAAARAVPEVLVFQPNEPSRDRFLAQFQYLRRRFFQWIFCQS